MAKIKKQLGQILLDAGKLTEKQLEDALQYKSDHGVYLGKAIIYNGFLTETELAQTLGNQLEIPYLDLMDYEIQDQVIGKVDEQFAREKKVIPLFSIDNTLAVAIADPMDIDIIDELNMQHGMDINLVIATESEIEQAIDLYYSAAKYLTEGQAQDGQLGAKVVSKELAEDTQIIEAVDMLLNEAVRIASSDIHIEPRATDVRIRFRVDGVLQQYYTIPKAAMSALISRVKILSGMDIAESRLPQDGRFTHQLGEESKVDLRVSAFPTPNGEKIVLRILDESKSKIELHRLGFPDETLKRWREVIHTPNGIIIVTGPTGSGKTTTLYSTLNVINSVEVNIMTIEDPIEYKLDNINQSQVNVKAGLTFSIALRSMLRQDPDIILVGEMRDVETIDLAIRSALTGHLVFSTLHTNDASSSFTRLLDMGVDAYLVSSSIRGIISQRLIRLLCPRCRQEYEPDENLLRTIKFDDQFKGVLFSPVGCVHCKNSGYFGRSGLFELLIPNEEITALVNKQATASEIEVAAVRNGMHTIRDAAMQYVRTGRTSVEELMRIMLV